MMGVPSKPCMKPQDPVTAFRVLSSTSPPVLAPRPVWGPRCGQLGAQVDATRNRDRVLRIPWQSAGDDVIPKYGERDDQQARKEHYSDWNEICLRLAS